jgi:putative aldouronate transport system permease protein
MIREKNLANVIVDIVIMAVLAVIALSCLLPFLHVIAVSLSERGAVAADRVGVIPIGFTIDNYAFILRNNQFFNSLWISIARVAVGVTTTLIIVFLTAYPLALDNIRMPGRLSFKVFMLVGFLFSGGLIPTFITYGSLGLINNFWVLILPSAINVFFIIIMMNFLRGIPHELAEAAWLDGASHLQVIRRVYLPISRPALATIGLFSAVGHWNSWFDGVVYLQQAKDWPLQSWLYSLVTTRQIQWQSAGTSASDIASNFQNATPDGLAAALIVVAALPIMMVYPFMQRYFVTGLTLGSVKS